MTGFSVKPSSERRVELSSPSDLGGSSVPFGHVLGEHDDRFFGEEVPSSNDSSVRRFIILNEWKRSAGGSCSRLCGRS